MSKFTDFDFHPKIIEAVTQLGYESPTPIQEGSFKALLNGKNFFGIAQTGGGKTGAFVIPILQRLSQSNMPAAASFPRAVILSPTRELALQILEAIHSFSKGMGIRQTCIYGGALFRPQINALNQSQDIIVATPGRLMDHVRRGNISFDDTEVFVLDEADRMLDMGFLNDVKEISAMLPKECQTVMFSATANKNIRALLPKILNDYEMVEIEGTSALPDTITHKLIYVNMRNKSALLLDILRSSDMEQSVVFTRTKRQADEVAQWLKDNDFRADAIHGDKKQNVRTRILGNFRNGRTAVLVATDVAARGIDVEAVTHVINYNMPMEAENYVHRVGRTGRAGRAGTAFSFCDGGDTALLRDVERFINMKIEIDDSSEYALDPASIAKMPTPRLGGGGGRNDRGGKRRSYGDKPSFGGGRGRDDNRSNDRGGERRSFGGDRSRSNDGGFANDRSSFGGNRTNNGERRSDEKRAPLKPRSIAAKAGSGMKRRSPSSVSRSEGFRKRVRETS